MNAYEEQVKRELKNWKRKMTRRPTLTDNLAKSTQDKINRMIPEKIHQGITVAIKNMVQGVLYGSVIGKPAVSSETLERRDNMIIERQLFYRNTAAVEGGITGFGGIVGGIADFPLLLSIKLKFLYDAAAIYGYDIKDFSERIYLLHIFQLAFSSRSQRLKIFEVIENWEVYRKTIPEDINKFNWREFQQEYRDHIDLAKMAQMLPVVGSVVGIVVNYRLLNRLAETAMNAYRMRWLNNKESSAT